MKTESKIISGENLLYLTTDLAQQYTGLRSKIWLTCSPGGDEQCFLYLQKNYSVRSDHNWLKVSVSNDPKILGKNDFLTEAEFDNLKRFIEINKSVIKKYWDYKIDSKELFATIKKIREGSKVRRIGKGLVDAE